MGDVRDARDARDARGDTAPARKIAVIGSGLAGLTTAYLLAEAGLDVWLIEKVGALGGLG